MADVDRTARRIAAPTMGLARSTELVAAGMRWETITRRIERGVWTRPHRGVIDVTGQGWTWVRRVLAATMTCPPGTVASFRTAGALLHLPGLTSAGRIEVTTPRRGRTREVPFVVHSTLLADTGVERDGVPCTSPVRTAIDLSRVLDDRAYARVVRELLRRGVVQIDHLEDDAPRRIPGHRRFALAVEREWAAAQLATESPLEDDTLEWLIAGGFSGFTTQVEVGVTDVRSGRPVDYRLDIAWTDERVVLSVLGARWHADALAQAADKVRKRDLRAAGWHVLDVRADDLHGAASDHLAVRIRRALATVSA